MHSKLCIEYGTKMVGGVNPKKGGQKHLGLPVFASVMEAKKAVNPDATVILVPAQAAARVLKNIPFILLIIFRRKFRLFQ